MKTLYVNYISNLLSVADWRVEHCVELLKDGATIPFISRYRKERTGGLDETQVSQIKHYLQRFEELEERKNSILESIAQQEKLTDDLKEKIENCVDSRTLEDLYLPYRPKRRTKASIAKEKGLEPLAEAIFNCKVADVKVIAQKYINDKVEDVDAALSGARDIMAEWISEIPKVRESLRYSYSRYGKIVSKLAKGQDEDSSEADKYQNYFDFSEDISRSPSHRVLAMLRGASEGVLSIKIDVDADRMMDRIYSDVLRKKAEPSDSAALELDYAVEDSYKRLLHPSIENEVLKMVKEKADIEAIKVFGENLTQLLMSPPLGQKRVLAIDPGYRTGCKVVCLDAQGALLHNDTIYPHPPQNERTMAMKKISNMVSAYKIEVIAIGNGTAGRETENFIKKMALPENLKVYSISEDGASVYSASQAAREEFPDYDVTVRGAVSIGRRIMDPLAELVKIDPKSIGVGQYQHDVDQTLLKNSLDEVVEKCVNSVGVNLNTASKHLLSYVSGIGPALAKNIVEHRDANGPFASRAQLLKVKRLGDKAYEQCAGFLRIPGASNPLDNTAVHPERYKLVEKMAKDTKVTVAELVSDESLRQAIKLESYVDEQVGMPTLTDIMSELAKPGRDPRTSYKVLEFAEDIRTIEDVKEGMVLPGIITNVTNFGAFVDFGIKQNGLIHISKLHNKKVLLHQHVKVRVLDVDIKRSRIALELDSSSSI
ncbi:MAG: RNA-binding transcriptional accessory protein [Bacteroidales bacterium]|nr:RNA-binding transcriptional accessory protein [Bacteroidales bacterium]